MPFANNLHALVDEAFRGKSFTEIAKAPVGVLGGINHTDGQKLMDALDVKTIAELAANRYVLWAQAIHNLAPYDRADVMTVRLATLIDPKIETKRLRELVRMSPAAFVGLSDKKAKMLEEAAQIRTIEDLATNRFVLVSQVIAHLARQEKLEGFKQAA